MVSEEMYRQVRAALAHAQALFGASEGAPAEPAPFAAPRGLEDPLGRGAFRVEP